MAGVMTELDKLLQALERAQNKPPELTQDKRTVPVPTSMRSTRDSRGRTRLVNQSMAKARQKQIERAKREMLSTARNELTMKAKEQLKP